MTLAEALVYCTLLSLFCTMLFVSLPNKANDSSRDLNEAIFQANKALAQLTLELGNASSTSITASKDPVGVYFLSTSVTPYADASYTPDGSLAWKGWVGYFVVKKTTTVKKETVTTSGLYRYFYSLAAALPRSAVTTTPTAAQIMEGTVGQVCGSVSSLTVSMPEAGLWQFDLKLEVNGSDTTLTTGTGARN